MTLVCSVLLLSGCITNSSGLFGLSENEQNEKKIVNIGVILPLTGTSADAGENVRKGLELAKSEINSKAQNNYRINIMYEDSQYDAKLAINAINKLILQDKTKFIISADGSTQFLAITQIAEQNKVILITPASQADKVSTEGDYIFRTQVSTAQDAEFISDYLNKKELGKVGIIALNTDYGKSFVNAFSKYYKKKISTIEYHSKDASDFKDIIVKFDSENIDTILLVTIRQSGGLILKQSKELGLNFKFYGTSAIEGQDVLDIAKESANDLIYSYPFDDTSNNPNMKKFQEKFFELYNKKAEMYSVNSYDTLMLLSKCFEEVGIETDNVRDCLYGIKDYQGASGVLTFDANGDVKKEFILKTVKGGKFIKLS